MQTAAEAARAASAPATAADLERALAALGGTPQPAPPPPPMQPPPISSYMPPMPTVGLQQNPNEAPPIPQPLEAPVLRMPERLGLQPPARREGGPQPMWQMNPPSAPLGSSFTTGLVLVGGAASTAAGAMLLGGPTGAGAGLFLFGGLTNAFRASRMWGTNRGEAAKAATVSVLGLAIGGYLAYRARGKGR